MTARAQAWAAALLGLAACAAVSGARPPLRVAAMGTVLGEIAAQVGGERAVVMNLIPPGVDPHTFSPSPGDMAAVVDADLVLISGVSLAERLAARARPPGSVLDIGETLPGALRTPGGERDPHWWHSIGNVILAADDVRGALAAARPADAGVFASNARAYEARLDSLKAWVAAQIATVPPGRRQLVTSHDAFGYFARDYGFTVHAIGGLSTEGEADARHVAELIDLIRRQGIPTLFAESSANPRLVADLMRETGARLGGTLFADGLGPPGSGAETYDAMYRHNVRAIVAGLAGP